MGCCVFGLTNVNVTVLKMDNDGSMEKRLPYVDFCMTDVLIKDEASYLEHYLVQCNAIIRANNNRFPYKEIWQACADTLRDHQIVLGLLEGERQDVMSVCFHLDQFHWMPIKRIQATIEPYYIPKSDIDALLDDPEAFANKPFLMDWDWLQQARTKPARKE